MNTCLVRFFFCGAFTRCLCDTVTHTRDYAGESSIFVSILSADVVPSSSSSSHIGMTFAIRFQATHVCEPFSPDFRWRGLWGHRASRAYETRWFPAAGHRCDVSIDRLVHFLFLPFTASIKSVFFDERRRNEMSHPLM